MPPMTLAMRTAPQPCVPVDVLDAVAAIGWDGVVVPRMRIFDFLLYPVVQLLPQAWEQRERSGVPPQLHQFTLFLWESWQHDMGEAPPPSPVRLVGLVATGKLRSALNALTAMSGYAPGLAVLGGSHGPRSLAAAEADLHDMSLAWVHPEGGAEVLWRGRQEPAATSAGRTTSVRHKEELIYAQMLSSGWCAAAASPAAIA